MESQQVQLNMQEFDKNKSSIVVFFNKKIFYPMLLELKKQNDTLNKEIRKRYQQFDHCDPQYIQSFYQWCKSYDTKKLDSDCSNGLEKVFGEYEFLKNININEVCQTIDTKVDVVLFRNYIYYLWACCLIWGMLEDETSIKNCLVEVLRIYNDIKQFQEPFFDKCTNQLIQTGALHVMKQMYREYSDNSELIQGQVLEDFKEDAQTFMSTMQNSKLKNIAEEVAQSMDMDKFKNILEPLVNKNSSSNANSGINFMEILNNPDVMGLVQDISGTIQNKLDKGDLNNDDIMNEAQSLMGFLSDSQGGNQMQDMLGGAMKQMLGGGLGGDTSGQDMSSMMNMFQGMMGGGGGVDNGPDQEDIINELNKMIEDKK